MIYETARYLTPAPYDDASPVLGSDADGNTETTALGTPAPFRQLDDGISGFLARGGMVEPYIELEPTVPAQVSPAQAEIALYNYDNGVLLGQVNALIDSYPYEPVRIWWRKATYISRRHPYLEAVAIEMELSDETVDALFVAAALF